MMREEGPEQRVEAPRHCEAGHGLAPAGEIHDEPARGDAARKRCPPAPLAVSVRLGRYQMAAGADSWERRGATVWPTLLTV